MATVSVSALVRSILSASPDMPTDEIIRRAKARGATASDKSIPHSVFNMKSVMNKEARAAKPVPAAARETPTPKPGAAAPAKAASVLPDVSGVLANVALVNKVVDVAGGVEQARQVAETVRSCGGVEGFLQHLGLVAGIRGANA